MALAEDAQESVTRLNRFPRGDPAATLWRTHDANQRGRPAVNVQPSEPQPQQEQTKADQQEHAEGAPQNPHSWP